MKVARRLILFDVDGTLVDSQGSIVAAMGAAFAQTGLAVPERASILSIVGLSLEHAMYRLAPDASAPVQAAIEACNGTADLAERLVDEAGWSVALAHPGYVHRLKQSPDKTDLSDAQLLADLQRVGYLPRVWLPPGDIRELRRLVRYRQSLVDQRRAVKQRIGALLRDHRILDAPARRWTKRWQQWARHHARLGSTSRWIMDQSFEELGHLQTKVHAAEQQLVKVVEGDGVVAKLMGLRGVGLITACGLRAEIGRFDRFRSGKQLSRFCGLTPRNASSGSRQADAGLIGAANRQLRALVIEAAWRLMLFDPRYKQLGQQMRARGKPGSVIAAAVGNRWLRWLYHQMQPVAVAA